MQIVHTSVLFKQTIEVVHNDSSDKTIGTGFGRTDLVIGAGHWEILLGIGSILPALVRGLTDPFGLSL
jgi:hypothetical protein